MPIKLSKLEFLKAVLCNPRYFYSILMICPHPLPAQCIALHIASTTETADIANIAEISRWDDKNSIHFNTAKTQTVKLYYL